MDGSQSGCFAALEPPPKQILLCNRALSPSPDSYGHSSLPCGPVSHPSHPLSLPLPDPFSSSHLSLPTGLPIKNPHITGLAQCQALALPLHLSQLSFQRKGYGEGGGGCVGGREYLPCRFPLPRGLPCSGVRQSQYFVSLSDTSGNSATGEVSFWHTN